MIGALYLSAANLLDDVRADLAAGNTPLPGRTGVTTGQISWLGQCDQLVVSIGNVWLTNNFPVPASIEPGGQCDTPLIGADLTLSLLRCFPTPDASGNPASTGALDAVAQTVGADLQTLANSVPCSLAEQLTVLIEDYVIGGFNVVGPDGGRISIEAPYKVCLRRG